MIRGRDLARALAASLLIVPATGCVSEVSTGPGTVDARGSYAGTWEVEKQDLSTRETNTESCAGSLTITEQTTAGRLSGSFRIPGAEGCAERGGGVEGEVRSGDLVLLLVVSGGSDIDLEDLTGCTLTVGGNALGGILSGDRLTAAATFLGECDGALSQVTLRFEGVR